MQRKESLDCKLVDFETAPQHVADDGSDPRNGGGDFEANLGGEVAEFVHGEQVAGETED